MTTMNFEVCRLDTGSVELMFAMLDLFGEAFDDARSYATKRPSERYLRKLLAGDSFIAVAAQQQGVIVGGIAAYELKKFEQERSEIYIYDLAVAAPFRRQGVATAMIEKLKEIAAARDAYVLFVQADTDEDDEPAIALYSRLGTREDVLHFDIPVVRQRAT